MSGGSRIDSTDKLLNGSRYSRVSLSTCSLCVFCVQYTRQLQRSVRKLPCKSHGDVKSKRSLFWPGHIIINKAVGEAASPISINLVLYGFLTWLTSKNLGCGQILLKVRSQHFHLLPLQKTITSRVMLWYIAIYIKICRLNPRERSHDPRACDFQESEKLKTQRLLQSMQAKLYINNWSRILCWSAWRLSGTNWLLAI